MTNEVRLAPMLIALLVTLCIVGLIGWARGPKHHRGDEIGTHGTKVVVVRTG